MLYVVVPLTYGHTIFESHTSMLSSAICITFMTLHLFMGSWDYMPSHVQIHVDCRGILYTRRVTSSIVGCLWTICCLCLWNSKLSFKFITEIYSRNNSSSNFICLIFIVFLYHAAIVYSTTLVFFYLSITGTTLLYQAYLYWCLSCLKKVLWINYVRHLTYI